MSDDKNNAPSDGMEDSPWPIEHKHAESAEDAGMKDLGLAGNLTRAFIKSPLTPLFLLAAFAFGLVALLTLPREEEAVEDLVERLMGRKPEARFRFIQENAEFAVADLDI